jgi:hypothetical protein
MRLIAAFAHAVLFLLTWYLFVDYAPALILQQVRGVVTYNEYIDAPDPHQYWPWFLVAVVAVVGGYVAHRVR